ncbi:MAG TPA: polymorphic toxin type 50 domain-containing protein [Candidatus Rhabdochlamydia sp.]|jgi:Bacterial toxin 50|nr:polymorphic toxin type 50 domain-containing protein [Candidatus Rhabdochlamydia sp.]
MKLYRELKKANNLLTLEALATSQKNKSLIALEAAKRARTRKEILTNANLKIQWDKQGKHIQTHKNFQKSKSILEHPDPQRLAHDFCGKGIKMGTREAGTAGYQEIVDFKEFIGYVVDRDTKKKFATSWGKIHYAQDGIHIVPTKPRL